VTIISWLTYPVVYILPMLGLSGASAMVGARTRAPPPFRTTTSRRH
jgi:hypothetical protein